MTNIIPEPNLEFKPEFKKINLKDFFSFVSASQEVEEFLKITIEIAEKRGEFLYFAGGVVRDYLLKRKTFDFDLVLEGNLQEFLKELAKKVKGKVVFKSQFLTFKFKLELKERKHFFVDFITARKEEYPEVACLPKVMPASWKEDVKRRDFTINSLIVGLSPPYKGILVDSFNGIKDLEKGLIRPLKPDSFVEDPTRIFRGIRYKVRFNFEFAEEFFNALEMCYQIQALKKLSSSRLRNELLLFLNKEPEENLFDLIETARQFKVLENAEITVERKMLISLCKILKEVKKEILPRERDKFFLLALSYSPENVERLGFSKEEKDKLIKYFKKFEEVYRKWGKLKIWEKVEFFEKIPLFFVLFLGIRFRDLREDVIRFVKEWRKIKPELTGGEIKNFGIKDGKRIGEILRILRRHKLEGKLCQKLDEIKFLKEIEKMWGL